MMTKEGIITKIIGKTAWVKTRRSKSCDSCESRDSCGEHSRIQEMTIQIENSLNASTGDMVVVGFKSSPLLKIAFLLYVFPIILLIIGAAIGESISITLNTDKSLTSLIAGILFFTISFLVIRLINNAWANKKEYQPFMMRFTKK
ncbi:MAG: SoxR reducing system RseC family protein [Desulfamplus sp.]|nr:SoxR reducing system RseC family protein [Desulfamplus sp.]